MDELRQLNKRVCELLNEPAKIQWLAMNADESAYCIEFKNQYEGNEWFRRNPKQAEHYHLVAFENWYPFAELWSYAGRLFVDMSATGLVKLSNGDGDSCDFDFFPYPKDISDKPAPVHTQGENYPEAIARGFIAWKEAQREG